MDEGFTSFVCDRCHTEIEASLDLIGEETECPACGTRLHIPDNRKRDGITRYTSDNDNYDPSEVLKSRTIRIDLGDF